MLSIIGHYLLLIIIIIYIYTLFTRDIKSIYIAYNINILLIFICMILLYLINIEFSDYAQISLNNTSKSMSLFYRIGSIWSSHEGSMLLWCFILSFYQLISGPSYNIISLDITRYVKIGSLINLFFLFYTFTTSNPFVANYIQSIQDNELNPVLQDPILIIHPPIIYLGYLGSSVLFTNVLILLRQSDYTKHDTRLKYVRIYSIISMSLLTIGIGLGSWWAYHELGWGGWWFWDPVENVSLLPWILYVVVIHNTIHSIKKKTTYSSVIIFSALSFFFSCYGTFFVRSGFITSVHSFITDDSKGLIILISILLFIIVFLHAYNNSMSNTTINESILIHLFNNINIIIVFIITIALIYPYIYYNITGQEVSVGYTFYNDMVLPMIIPLVLLMFYCMNYKFRYRNKYLVYSIVYICIIYKILDYYNRYINISIISSILYTVCICIIVTLIYNFIELARRLRSSWIPIIHAGVIISILGALLSNEGTLEVISSINIGESIKIDKYIFMLRDINIYQNDKYYSMYASLLIENSDYLFTSFPEKRLYMMNNTVLTKSSIITNKIYDIYSLVGNGNYDKGWYIRLYINPYIVYLFIGIICTSVFTLSFIVYEYNKHHLYELLKKWRAFLKRIQQKDY